jgi:hypothetical protein
MSALYRGFWTTLPAKDREGETSVWQMEGRKGTPITPAATGPTAPSGQFYYGGGFLELVTFYSSFPLFPNSFQLRLQVKDNHELVLVWR